MELKESMMELLDKTEVVELALSKKGCGTFGEYDKNENVCTKGVEAKIVECVTCKKLSTRK